MEDEHRNEHSAGSGANDAGASGMNTDNREPVVVAEQPARPVEEGSQGRETAGGDSGSAWNSPSGPPSQQDQWKKGADHGTGYSGSTGGGRPDNGPPYQPAPPVYGGGQTGGQGGQQGGQQGGTSQYHTQYQAQYQRQTQIQEKNTMSTASLVMGILSLVSCCCTWIGIVFGVLGIVFALMSRTDGQMDGQAKAGLILSIIGIVLDILIIILVIFLQIFTMLPDLSLFN